jgi:hypothetical protein
MSRSCVRARCFAVLAAPRRSHCTLRSQAPKPPLTRGLLPTLALRRSPQARGTWQAEPRAAAR